MNDITPENRNTPGVAVPFISGAEYYSGQLVTYYGNLYIVNVTYPYGYPGRSSEFSIVSSPGPAGLPGLVGPRGNKGPTGPNALVVKHDYLATSYEYTSVFSADQPINLGFNTKINGTCIKHTDLTPQINIEQDGLYLIYYNSLIHGGFRQNYPLYEEMSLCQDGVKLPDSKRTVLLTSPADIKVASGLTIVNIKLDITKPVVITLSSASDDIASDHTEVVVEKLL